MERDSLDARGTDNRNVSHGGCFDFGCLPCIVFIVAVIVDFSFQSGPRAVRIAAYLAVIGLLWYGYYRKKLPWGALYAGLQVFSIGRICSIAGLDHMITHLIRR